MIRFFDIVFSFLGLTLGFPVFLLLTVIGLIDTGAPIYWQERVGRRQKPFTLFKFRTMKKNTAAMATHLVNEDAITGFGRILRRTKLDELPQLWNVLLGDMSLVGPRPSLFNQTELISERERLGVLNHRPGITGLSQLRQIDMSTPELLAETDKLMLETLTLKGYFIYIVMTALGKKAHGMVPGIKT